MKLPRVTEKLLLWYAQHGRKNLPWQKNRTPYRVWISEIMLQQTQVQTVTPYYLRFLDRFPKLDDLAMASLDDVLSLWSGLGYYRRARHLHQTAIIIHQQYQGHFPNDLATMMSLPGIGRSTASAILAFSRQAPLPILDGNVKRVLTRLHAIKDWPGKPQVEKKLWQLAADYTPKNKDVVDYTQAIMDFGASLCKRTAPLCHQCPLSQECLAFKEQAVDAYPVKAAKKTLPLKYLYMIILTNKKGEVLLQRRPETGIWGGLWSFPESNNKELPDILSAYTSKIDKQTMEILAPFRHVFTHYVLIATPIRYYLKTTAHLSLPHDHFYWHDPKTSLSKGIPALIQRILLSEK